MTIEEIVEQVGESVHAQITYTWNTKQTLEQYAEILRDSGEGEDIEMDKFIEYVRSNAFDILAEDAGNSRINKDIFILDESGAEVSD